MNIETVPIENLKPHPQNYKEHPENQLDHIIKSINEHGFYRNTMYKIRY
jgi:ParB-like chromosome segregation protein Spo0J